MVVDSVKMFTRMRLEDADWTNDCEHKLDDLSKIDECDRIYLSHVQHGAQQAMYGERLRQCTTATAVAAV